MAGIGDPTRPALIVLHTGAGLNPWARAAAAALSTEGFRVFAPDLLSGKEGSGPASVVGFSWGGTEAFAYAARQPRLAAAVIYYGLPPSGDLLRAMTVPVLGLYGAADESVTPTVAETEATMRVTNRTYMAKIFAGASHGFVPRQEAEGGPNSVAAATAWREMLIYLRTMFATARGIPSIPGIGPS